MITHCIVCNAVVAEYMVCASKTPIVNCPWRDRCSVEHHQRGKVEDGAIHGLLNERHKTHGNFTDNANISQGIKHAMFGYKIVTMNVVHREALEMIAMKIARICSGHADFKDHWDDIAGYAKLGSDQCNG